MFLTCLLAPAYFRSAMMPNPKENTRMKSALSDKVLRQG